MTKSIAEEFSTLKELITDIMEKNPETRDNDTVLYLKTCERLGARTFSDLEKLNLNIITVHKVRQIIQNKEGLFPPSEKVKKIRSHRKVAIREYMSRLQ